MVFFGIAIFFKTLFNTIKNNKKASGIQRLNKGKHEDETFTKDFILNGELNRHSVIFIIHLLL